MNALKRPPDFNIEVGRKLKFLRQRKGLSQSDLGRVTRVSFQQIGKYEHGADSIPLSKLLALAAFLDVNPAFFWSDAGYNFTDAIPRDKVIPFSDDKVTRLVDAYSRIQNPRLRKSLLELMLQLTEATDMPVALSHQ